MRILAGKEHGQGLVELALILAIIAVMIFAVALLIREQLTTNLVIETVLDDPASNNSQEPTPASAEDNTDEIIKVILRTTIILATFIFILVARIFIRILRAVPPQTIKGNRHSQKSWKGKRYRNFLTKQHAYSKTKMRTS